MPPLRLQRYLSQSGVAARRKSELLITAGRVTVNGVVVTELGSKVDPDTDRVQVDGTAVYPEERFYIVLNKPKGCLTAVSDDRGRPTVMEYLPNLPAAVVPVGRLDFYTEGVLLLTNDGELSARLQAPRYHVEKTYHAKVKGNLRDEDIEQLRKGVRLDDGTMTLPAQVELLPGESRHDWLAVTLVEGKQRQIHRMLESVRHEVQKLQRVAYGNITFHGLRVGDARELTQAEVNQLRDLVGLDHSAGSRGRWSSQREHTDIVRRARARELADIESEEAAAVAAGREPDAAGRRYDMDRDRAIAPRGGPRADGTRGPRADAARPAARREPSSERAPRSDRGPTSDRGPSSERGPRREPSGPRREPSSFRGPSSERGPRREPSGPRREPSSRSEAPRRGPGEYARGPRSDGPRPSGSRSDGPRPSRPRSDGPPPSGPRSDGPRPSRPRSDGPRPSAPRSDGPRPSGPRSDGPRPSRPRSDGPRPSGPRSDGPRPSGPRSDGPRPSGPRSDGPRPSGPRSDGPRPSRPRSDGPRPSRPSGPRSDGPRPSRPSGPRSDGPRSSRPSGPRSDGPRPSRPSGPRSDGPRRPAAPGGRGPARGGRSRG